MLKKIGLLTLALVIFITTIAMGKDVEKCVTPKAAKKEVKKEKSFKPTSISPAKEPHHLVKVLRTTNKAQTNRYVCKAIEFKNTNPFNVVNYFENVVSREEGGVYSFSGPDCRSGYLVVICPEYQIPSLEKIAKELDRSDITSSAGSKYIFYRLRNRNISDPAFQSIIAYYAGANGILVPDIETNSLLIYDAPEGADYVKKSLDEVLDKPLPQVEMMVKIYEVAINNDGDLGLAYEAWKNGPGGLLFEVQSTGNYSSYKNGGHRHSDLSGGGFYVNYPSAFFDFLVEKGKATALANTKITSISGVPSTLATGDQITYYKIDVNDAAKREMKQNQTSKTVAGTTFPVSGHTISSVNTGIYLQVTPVIAEQIVNLNLNLKVINNLGYDDTGAPLLSSRQISDQISVANCDDVIFGGLTRERKIQTTQKMPFLGSLPIIGYLFGGEMTTSKKSIIVTSITPRPICDSNNKTAEDDSITKKVTGEEVVKLPESEYCFEQSASYIY